MEAWATREPKIHSFHSFLFTVLRGGTGAKDRSWGDASDVLLEVPTCNQ